ncbi:MAG: pentapeptide repeat-containing protein [Deltaproteobacteria bacterium]|nr:pentapeptide repeat-containing protein [Deltaproteobacteria bacterium]
MAAYTKEQLEGLIGRWEGHREGVKNLIPIIKSDENWHKSKIYQDIMHKFPPLPEGVGEKKKDLRGVNLWRANLSGANLEGTDLSGANLEGADLSGASLTGANLSGAHLTGANLSGANLMIANLSGALLWGADLSGANLGIANLSGASLDGVNLSGKNLWGANLSGASLKGANLSGAILMQADLSEANLMIANLSEADLWGANLSGANRWDVFYTTDEFFARLTKWWIPFLVQHISLWQYVPLIKDVIKKKKPIKVTNFLGIDTTTIDGSKNPVLKRHIQDYQFVQAFKKKSWFHKWFFYPLWKYTCDCGRSLLLWLIWSLGFVVIFSIIYSSHLHWFKQSAELGWFDVLYFSVVTFTTLGFGDVTPHHGNVAAQSWIMIEVAIGYIMLGGLVSILANKLARRA